MNDFVQGMQDGEIVLGIPFITMTTYLSVPRHVRWTFYLAAALTLSRPVLLITYPIHYPVNP